MSENSSASKKKSKTESPDPEKVSYAENYLQTNMAHYPIESLKSALIAGGYLKAEVEEAVFNINNPQVPDPSINAQGLLDIGSLFSNTFNFFKDNFFILFLIQLVASAPGILMQIINYESINELNNLNETDPSLVLKELGEALVFLLSPINIFLAIAIICLTLLGIVALYRGIIEIDHGKEIDLVKAYKDALPFMASYIGASILYGLAVVFGILMIIIPGIIFMVWFIFYGFTVTYEKKGAVESLKRSRELVKGYWWAIFGRYLLGVILVGIISGFLGIFGLIPYLGPIFQGVVQAASSVFITIYLYNIYKGIRAIKG